MLIPAVTNYLSLQPNLCLKLLPGFAFLIYCQKVGDGLRGVLNDNTNSVTNPTSSCPCIATAWLRSYAVRRSKERESRVDQMAMIDFKELPSDGVAFEQLVRELLFVAGLAPEWTGKGVDEGRDLLAEETAIGPIGSFRRRWLVSCKHFSHSGRAVGVRDLPSIRDDCSRVNADGFLLACSTIPSSGVIKKLAEISSIPSNRLVTAVWDGVELQKRLYAPQGFPLAHLFFSRSMARTPWRIYNTGSPSNWTAHFKQYFLHLGCRDSGQYPDLSAVEVIIERLEKIKPRGIDETIRPRAAYFDDKHSQFMVFADYLIPENASPSLTPRDFDRVLHDWRPLLKIENTGVYPTGWDVLLVRARMQSDHYHQDHKDYYEKYLDSFKTGIPRRWTIGDLLELNQWLSP